jgi:hypothetical protein
MRIEKPILAMFAAAAFSLTSSAQYHKYDVWDENYTVQGLLGAVQYENLKFDAPNSGGQTEVDVSILPQIGGAWTTLPIGDRFQVGLETTFLLGFRFDKINYIYAGSGGTYISLSTSMWMFDFSGGAYANFFLDQGKKVRLYVGGGPLMAYAAYRTESQYDDGTTPTETDNESAFGIGAYARTGIEFRVQERGTLGVGVRGSWSSVDFTQFGGSSELVGIAAFVTYTAGF